MLENHAKPRLDKLELHIGIPEDNLFAIQILLPQILLGINKVENLHYDIIHS